MRFITLTHTEKKPVLINLDNVTEMVETSLSIEGEIRFDKITIISFIGDADNSRVVMESIETIQTMIGDKYDV